MLSRHLSRPKVDLLYCEKQICQLFISLLNLLESDKSWSLSTILVTRIEIYISSVSLSTESNYQSIESCFDRMNSIDIIFVLVAAVAAASVTLSRIVPTESGIETSNSFEHHRSEFKEYFDRIDDYLIKTLDNDEPEANIEAAKKWLDIEQQANGDQNLIEALKIFTSLESIVNKNFCNRESLEILMKNDEATGGHALTPSKNIKQLRRVEKVIGFYATKHADTCMTSLKKYKARKDNCDEKKGDGKQERDRLNRLENQPGPSQNEPPCKASMKSQSSKVKSFFLKLMRSKKAPRDHSETGNRVYAVKSSSGESSEDKKTSSFFGHSGGNNNNNNGSFLDQLLLVEALNMCFEALFECCGLIGECCGACGECLDACG